jgi:selenocysteine lyase/cysteine desulfurase
VEREHISTTKFEAAWMGFQAAYPQYEATAVLDELLALLMANVYGNPHSASPSSLAATHLVEHARRYVLEFFNASPDW